jgi:hypothetical protein
LVFAERRRENVEHVLDEAQLHVDAGRCPLRKAHEAIELRVLDEGGLGKVGLRDPNLLERRLERPVVDKGDADGPVDAKVVLQQLPDRPFGFLPFRGGSCPSRTVARRVRDGLLDIGESRAGVHARATGEKRAGADRKQAFHRGCSSCGLGGCFTSVVPQIGHWPGFASLTCACLGHEYTSAAGDASPGGDSL